MKTSNKQEVNPERHSPCVDCPTKSEGFFCSFGDEIINTIDHIKIDTSYKAGESIYTLGSFPKGIYSVREGVVKIEILTAAGQANTLNFIGPGGLLGYRSFFKNENHSTSAIAIEDCRISFLPSVEVNQLFKCHPELTLKMVSKLAEDVKIAETRWLHQINKSAPARVAEALLFLDENFRQVHWTRKEIAEWAGTTPETVIRTLSAFESDGILKRNIKNFTVLDYPKLILKSL